MLDESIDLSVLDPDHDSGAEDRFLQAVMSSVEAASAAAPRDIGPLIGIWSFAGWAAVAAAVIIGLALGIKAVAPPATAGPRTVADAMGVPAEFLAVSAPRLPERP